MEESMFTGGGRKTERERKRSVIICWFALSAPEALSVEALNHSPRTNISLCSDLIRNSAPRQIKPLMSAHTRRHNHSPFPPTASNELFPPIKISPSYSFNPPATHEAGEMRCGTKLKRCTKGPKSHRPALREASACVNPRTFNITQTSTSPWKTNADVKILTKCLKSEIQAGFICSEATECPVTAQVSSSQQDCAQRRRSLRIICYQREPWQMPPFQAEPDRQTGYTNVHVNLCNQRVVRLSEAGRTSWGGGPATDAGISPRANTLEELPQERPAGITYLHRFIEHQGRGREKNKR